MMILLLVNVISWFVHAEILTLFFLFTCDDADNYISYVALHSRAVDNDLDRISVQGENGFLWDDVNPVPDERPENNGFPNQNPTEV